MKRMGNISLAALLILSASALACICLPVIPASPAWTDTLQKGLPTQAIEPTKTPPEATLTLTATVMPPTASPSSTFTNTAIAPSPTAEPQVTLTPSFNRRDAGAVIQALKNAMSEGSVTVYEQLTSGDVGYVNYIEGGQLVTRLDFLDDVAERSSSQPVCDFYGYDSGRLLVFTSGWSPAWQMTEFCYTECSPLDPPWESSIAAFFFNDDGSGWTLQTVWLNDASIWEDVYQVEFTSCR